ncbi:MAG: ABC transporter permease [Anaerolineae bacterium]|nr:ABC transporter permease [Anaerolineae bacterium]MDW8098151.1 ABC transporter permease [Anaerolineae bacterium]
MKTLRELLRDARFSLGAVVALVLILLALLSFFSPYNPTEWRVVPRDMPPSWKHPLGTDSKGQDIFWQMTFAVRNSLALAILAAAISRVIAVTVGLVAGYSGGILDRVLMFISDGFLVMPLFLIIVMLAMLVREHMNTVNLALLLGVLGWAWDARLIRSQVLSLREREFTYTAILSGTPMRKLIFNEYSLFVMPLVFTTLINNMAWVIGMEITLALIGLTNPDIPTLGAMLRWAVSYQAMLLGLWWWILAPIAISIALFVALYLVSLGISEYLDPRARIQRVGVR